MRPLLLGLFAAALLAAQPAEDDALQRTLAISDSAPRLTAILQFLSRYPNSPGVSALITRAFDGATRARSPELAAEISRRLAKASSTARSDAARTLALIRFSGRNGLRLHPMVVRASCAQANCTFPVDRSAAHLALIAVAQDAANKRVLQSAYREVEPQL